MEIWKQTKKNEKLSSASDKKKKTQKTHSPLIQNIKSHATNWKALLSYGDWVLNVLAYVRSATPLLQALRVIFQSFEDKPNNGICADDKSLA